MGLERSLLVLIDQNSESSLVTSIRQGEVTGARRRK
jgi:hypothetical protein